MCVYKNHAGAYLDLIMRSCPKGLQGTTLMLASSLYFVVSRSGDLLGTHLYDHFGSFDVCVIAITVVYALMLPVMLLIPKELLATSDGEPNPVLEAEVMREIAETAPAAST